MGVDFYVPAGINGIQGEIQFAAGLEICNEFLKEKRVVSNQSGFIGL